MVEFRYGSGLWDGEERSGRGIDGGDEAGAGNEINSASSYGRSVGYLWLNRCCYYQHRVPKAKSYYLFDGYAHLSSGLACGLAGLAAGMAIGIVGDAGVRCAIPSYIHH